MEFERTILPGIPIYDSDFGDERHIARLSNDDVERLQRVSDGLTPGSIVISTERGDLPDISVFPDYIQQKAKTVPLEDLEHMILSATLEITDKVIETEHLLTETCRILELLQDDREGFIASKSEYLIPQYETIASILDDFMALNPDAVFDDRFPGSMSSTSEFIIFYRERVHEQLQSDDIVNFLQGRRQLLVDAVKRSDIKRIFGAKATANIAKYFEQQPIVVSDPLSVAILRDASDTDVLGWYVPKKRICYIDPISIKQYAAENEQSYEVSLFATMTHELLHAATSGVYRAHSYENDFYITNDSVWPEFFYEAMVEKAALLIIDKADPDLLNGITSYSGRQEQILRELCSDNPRELLAPKELLHTRQIIGSAYSYYRLLVDTIMDKASWTKAGLTRAKADSLAIRAFFEVEDNTTTSSMPGRKAFMRQLHTATHSGFLNKIADYTTRYGIKAGIDLLESPEFDISDPTNLPFMGNPRILRFLKNAEERLETDKRLLERIKQLDASDEVITETESRVEKRRKVYEAARCYELAERGLGRIMLAKYGERQRHLDARQRLLVSIFGEKGALTEHTFPELTDLDQAHEAVANWKARYENRSSWR